MEEEFEQREMHKATCAECGEECEVPFEPTEGKDVFCQDCFKKRKGPRRDFGRSPRRFDRDRGPKEMHKATCADCGNECEVPFKPTEGRDVFCQDCFRKKRED